MKTEIKIPDETPKELKFPLLAKYKPSGAVFRFIDKRQAVKLICSDGSSALECQFNLGSYDVTESAWQILPPGTRLTLIQE